MKRSSQAKAKPSRGKVGGEGKITTNQITTCCVVQSQSKPKTAAFERLSSLGWPANNAAKGTDFQT